VHSLGLSRLTEASDRLMLKQPFQGPLRSLFKTSGPARRPVDDVPVLCYNQERNNVPCLLYLCLVAVLIVPINH